jgi:hypothetical protein
MAVPGSSAGPFDGTAGNVSSKGGIPEHPSKGMTGLGIVVLATIDHLWTLSTISSETSRPAGPESGEIFWP